jgi:hypothetical protein
MAFDYAAKIAALLANAEDESLSDEARASYRAKAESLMQQYRIAEEDLIATDQFAAVPVKDRIVIMEANAFGNPMAAFYRQLFSRIVRHAGIRAVFKTRENRDAIDAVVIGYEGDLAYAKMIWTAARLAFLTRIDARVDRSISDQLNCYYMRGSGMARKDIATALWGSGPKDGAAHGKVQKLYVAECAARGETPAVSGRGIQVDLFRQSYAEAFVNALGWRLSESKDAAGATGGLVLHGRKERVDEAFYKEFPHHRPATAEESRKAAEAAEASWRRILDECKNCRPEAAYLCKRHRPSEATMEDQRRWDRRANSAEARAGQRAGMAAAESVNLQRGDFTRKQETDAANRSAIQG